MRKLIRRIRRAYWRLHLIRCECGYIIWPWQKTAEDFDLGTIHRFCGTEDDPLGAALHAVQWCRDCGKLGDGHFTHCPNRSEGSTK